MDEYINSRIFRETYEGKILFSEKAAFRKILYETYSRTNYNNDKNKAVLEISPYGLSLTFDTRNFREYCKNVYHCFRFVEFENRNFVNIIPRQLKKDVTKCMFSKNMTFGKYWRLFAISTIIGYSFDVDDYNEIRDNLFGSFDSLFKDFPHLIQFGPNDVDHNFYIIPWETVTNIYTYCLSHGIIYHLSALDRKIAEYGKNEKHTIVRNDELKKIISFTIPAKLIFAEAKRKGICDVSKYTLYESGQVNICNSETTAQSIMIEPTTAHSNVMERTQRDMKGNPRGSVEVATSVHKFLWITDWYQKISDAEFRDIFANSISEESINVIVNTIYI